jgi:hypothetical protein
MAAINFTIDLSKDAKDTLERFIAAVDKVQVPTVITGNPVTYIPYYAPPVPYEIHLACGTKTDGA